MISLSKLEIVRRHLLAELAKAEYVPGAPFPSENELARHLRICKNTVREAMSGLVAEGRLIRKRGRGTFVGETTAATSAEGGRPKVLQLLVGDFLAEGESNPFISAVIAGLHAELDAHDYQILVTCIPDSDKGSNQLKYFPVANCSAIMLAGFDASQELLELIHQSKIPAVTVGRAEPSLLPSVYTDHRAGMRRAAEHLLQNGHRKIALIDSPNNHAFSYHDRREGFLDAMDAAGLVPDARLIFNYQEFDKRGQAKFDRLWERNADFTAAIIYGHEVAYAFWREAERNGKRVPEDLSLVLYASNHRNSFALTSFSWSLRDLARTAARRLLTDDPKRVECIQQVVLHEGDSVKPCKIAANKS